METAVTVKTTLKSVHYTPKTPEIKATISMFYTGSRDNNKKIAV
jgi:hypothetical protein